MSTKPEPKHPAYVMIQPFAKVAGYNLVELAQYLGINPQTLRKKINGQSDFRDQEMRKLSALTGRSYDDLFLT